MSVPEAFQGIHWPEVSYDMPRTVFDVTTFDYFTQTLKGTVGSLVNVGVLIMGMIVSVCLINFVFDKYIFRGLKFNRDIRKREYRRKVTAADAAKNWDSVVEDRVLGMRINAAARRIYRESDREQIVDDKIREKEIQMDVHRRFQMKNRDQLVEDGVRDQELRADIRRKYQGLNHNRLVEDGVRDRELRADIHRKHQEVHHDQIVEDGVRDMEIRAEIRAEYERRHPEVRRDYRRKMYDNQRRYSHPSIEAEV